MDRSSKLHSLQSQNRLGAPGISELRIMIDNFHFLYVLVAYEGVAHG
jgi:hypothetical protein